MYTGYGSTRRIGERRTTNRIESIEVKFRTCQSRWVDSGLNACALRAPNPHTLEHRDSDVLRSYAFKLFSRLRTSTLMARLHDFDGFDFETLHCTGPPRRTYTLITLVMIVIIVMINRLYSTQLNEGPAESSLWPSSTTSGSRHSYPAIRLSALRN